MRAPLVVGVAVLVVLAGCGAIHPQTQSESSSEPTAHETPSTATATDTATTPDSTATSTTSPEPLFAFDELSNESRKSFRRLLDAQHVESPEPLFGPRIADQHYTTFYITYEGDTYEIRHQRQSQESKTCLQDLTPVPNDTIDDGSQVGDYQNLSSDGQRLFDRVANGTDGDTCYDPSSYLLAGYSHVLHEGTYYRLVELQGSSYVYTYSLENVTDET